MCTAWSAACRGDEFRCAVSNFCLAPSWRCDGEPDCGAHDASDEDPYMCTYHALCSGHCGSLLDAELCVCLWQVRKTSSVPATARAARRRWTGSSRACPCNTSVTASDTAPTPATSGTSATTVRSLVYARSVWRTVAVSVAIVRSNHIKM